MTKTPTTARRETTLFVMGRLSADYLAPGGVLRVTRRWRTYPIAAMSPILESVDMDGFSQVLTCALSIQSFRRVNTERAILPPRLRRPLKPEVEDVATVVSIAARAAGDRMSRECNLSMMASLIRSAGSRRFKYWD